MILLLWIVLRLRPAVVNPTDRARAVEKELLGLVG
jgi:hypothetical protein